MTARQADELGQQKGGRDQRSEAEGGEKEVDELVHAAISARGMGHSLGQASKKTGRTRGPAGGGMRRNASLRAFGIRTVGVLARLAVGAGEDEEDDGTDERDQGDEQPPA